MSACFDMKYQYALCSGLLVCLLLFSSISESYGHGLGYEIMNVATVVASANHFMKGPLLRKSIIRAPAIGRKVLTDRTG